MLSRQELRDRVFLQVARGISKLGTCSRARVGAVLIRDGRAVSWGYNGSPPGLPHCDENAHGWALPRRCIRWDPNIQCILTDPQVMGSSECECGWRISECLNSTHAEANAIAFAARQGISTDGCTLYCDYTPCATCARLIIAAGIVRVVAAEAYRDNAGAKLLSDAMIPVWVGGIRLGVS